MASPGLVWCGRLVRVSASMSMPVYLPVLPRSRAQDAVLTKLLGVSKVFCVVAFPMGGQQAYHTGLWSFPTLWRGLYRFAPLHEQAPTINGVFPLLITVTWLATECRKAPSKVRRLQCR